MTVKWMNYGVQTQTVADKNGSWKTGPILSGASASITFDKPGTYTYILKEHPWSIAQLIVVSQESQDGMYSVQQASRGKAQYTEKCAACHLETLSGAGMAPALAGDAFAHHWQNHNLSDLFDRIRTTMPQDKPGSLSAQATVDILAFLLQSNGIPAGENELKGEPAILKDILFDKNGSR
jgi:cytochrome c